jgi:toxin-antitoxin system PIN domain toxin
VLSIDTNILMYAQNADCAEHHPALTFVTECGESDDVAICELALVELYVLLRNPAVVSSPLSAQDAVEVCGTYRRNPRWRLIENAPVMDDVWTVAGTRDFARRRIIDARLAMTLRHHGVTQLATANTGDFDGFGFELVFNPLVA